MPKAKKLPKITTLRNKLDKEFNAYIRERDKKCILSGVKEKLVCSHFYGKVACPNLRWNEKNAHAMSMRIHWIHHHGREPDYAFWMFETYSAAEMGELYKESKKKIVYTREMLLKKIVYYQEKRNTLR
jgi:hypothetical protein